MSSAHTQDVAPRLERIAARLRAMAQRDDRAELVERIDQAAGTLTDTTAKVVVVGQFKQGKSALVNALVGGPICPVDDVVATAVPTAISWGERPRASLVTEMGREAPDVRTQIDPRELRRHVTELAGETGLVGALHAEVTLPCSLLRDGLVLVDTPGVGRAQAQVSTNLTLLPQADATIMLTDATQELTEPELAFLRQATALCSRLTCVISKVDLQHQWRRIIEADREHLAAEGIEAPLLVSSALLHDLAAREHDAALAEEAGIGALASYLRNTVHADVLAERRQAVVEDIEAVAEHLILVLQAELQAISDPDGGAQTVQTLEQAQEVAARLTRRSARWQQTLSDGAAELVSDLEFDLRDRLRSVGRETEQLIDDCDPGEVWEDVGAWLSESVTQAVSDNFVWAHQRSEHLAEVVARHFVLEGRAAVPDLDVTGTEQVLRAVGGLDFVQAENLSVGQKVMIGMKGSYGGVLMFGLMTSLAGMALVNPLSIAAGLVMGGFAYRQDAKQRLEKRRLDAKTAVRRLIDESIFQVGKESRDRTGRVKRVLRDHFVAVAEDLKRSLQESVRAAGEGAVLPRSERPRRAALLSGQIAEIRALSQEASALTGREALALTSSEASSKTESSRTELRSA